MRIKFIILFMLIGLVVQAQTYTIVHSIGQIYDTQSGKYLTRGMKISESAKLQFQSPGAKAAALSSTSGRFVIQEQSATDGKSEISYALSSVLSPARGKLSTRAGGINNKLDFEKKFGEGAVAILSDVYKFSVSPSAYPMDDNRFFYASYAYGKEAVNKKLDSNGDSLVINITSFYSVDNKPVNPEETSNTKLFYYNVATEESTFITDIELSIVSKEDLKSMVGHMSEIHVSERNKAILEIINGVIGKCSEKELELALTNL